MFVDDGLGILKNGLDAKVGEVSPFRPLPELSLDIHTDDLVRVLPLEPELPPDLYAVDLDGVLLSEVLVEVLVEFTVDFIVKPLDFCFHSWISSTLISGGRV